MDLRRHARAWLGSVALVCGAAAGVSGQVAPSPTPAGAESGQTPPQETVTVFTEEVLIPVRVTDAAGRFDPTFERRELLVLEDGVPQEVTGARRLPASVLVVVGTSGELNPSVKTNASREAAARLVSQLRAGDRVAVLQYGAAVEAVQGWTEDLGAAALSVGRGLSSKRGARLGAALLDAAARFEGTPVGNRHLVLITDGVDDSADGGESLQRAVRGLLASGVSVHVLGYMEMGRRAIRKTAPPFVVSAKKPRKTANDIAAEIMNPIKAESKAEKPDLYLTIDLDVRMRRRRADYVRAMREGGQRLGALAEETGGALTLPSTEEELAEAAASIARDIGSRYVVAYRPKRPLSAAGPEEYRRVEVFARRVGLSVSARRGYVVPPTPPQK